MSLETDILWKRINELEKEVATLQRRLAGAETEMHKERELASYYRGRYETVSEIKHWWRKQSAEEQEEYEHERETE